MGVYKLSTAGGLATPRTNYSSFLAGNPAVQFTAYDSEEKGFYGKHIDMMYKSNGTRKLSMSVQLSEPEDYEGGSLLLYTGEEPLTLPKSRGTALFFPSYSLHEVTPVTKGLRYSLVAWFLGPRFK